jgi:hypothetical protein
VDWEQLLEEYRGIGGVAENIRLGDGAFGRGVFPIDPQQPVRIFTPLRAMVPVTAVAIEDGRLRVLPGRVDDDVARFFERYEQYWSWGAGGYDEALAVQSGFHALPQHAVEFISSMGALESPGARFLPPGDATVFEQFVRSRAFRHDGHEHFVPMVDLVNHAGGARGYLSEGGFGVAGTFAGEAFVRYNRYDAWQFALTHGFGDEPSLAHSLRIDVAVGAIQLVIERHPDAVAVNGGMPFPAAADRAGTLRLSHVMLGNTAGEDLPRGIFRNLLRPHYPAEQADATFERISQFNRNRFVDLLRILESCDGRFVATLRGAALNQLTALNACAGARPL